MAHPFELSHEIEVDASPEEVWEAIATGPGVDAWFMGRNEIEPREGGATRMAFRGSTEEATVTAWEPPTRFASRTPQGEDGSLHAFEYIVEGRHQGSTVVRWVHSGFLGENWEKEYEGLSEGDPMYFDKLRVYLTYFRGRTATPVLVSPACHLLGDERSELRLARRRRHLQRDVLGPLLGQPLDLDQR